MSTASILDKSIPKPTMTPAVCLALTALVLVAYLQAKDFEFLDFDDSLYVTQNPYVQAGLTQESIEWSFSFNDKYDTYWHPLTWLSHMLDVRLFGLEAGPHHLMNVLLHTVNACLLFLILKKMTFSIWSSCLAAAVFAVHPINVESVAWIAERKNLLSTLFWSLTIFAYLRYIKTAALLDYGLMLFVFLLGLMAKPMLVTLPCVLLLLDVWPLKRIKFLHAEAAYIGDPSNQSNGLPSPKFAEVVMEKLPLLLMAVLVAYLTASSVAGAESEISFDSVPLNLRLQNAVVACMGYLGKLIWPSRLAIFYPYPREVSTWIGGAAFIALVGITILSITMARKRPYLLVGWLWFICTLVPVSGLIQRGLWPALADRWAYLPSIGILIAVIWGVAESCRRWCVPKEVCAAVVFAYVLTLATVCNTQAATWKNTKSVFQNAVKVIPGNYVAHDILGTAFEKEGNIDEAYSHYIEAARIQPDFYSAYENIGILFCDRGNFAEAEPYLEKALSLRPTNAAANYNYGNALMEMGKIHQAIQHYSVASRLDPLNQSFRNNLGQALMKAGQIEAAILQFQEAVHIDSKYAIGYNNLGIAFLERGELDEAVRHFQKAISANPDFLPARENLKTFASINKN
jgi:Tfp pilus assembly protein PilF